MSGSLTLVTTPIGNLSDMCPRGIEALVGADMILCEDTRQTAKLLSLLQLKGQANAELRRCDEHREDAQTTEVLERLARGENLALVSDAGTPLISDPGFRLVRAVRAAGHRLTATPGPAAPIMALILSGLPTDRFYFGGFLPTKAAARAETFAELASLRATLIFFENPKRLSQTLSSAIDVFGEDRPAATAREITKKFEEVQSLSLGALRDYYASIPAPKGEMVLLIGGASKSTETDDLDTLLRHALADMPASAAAKQVANLTGLRRSEVYAKALKLKGEP